MATVTSEFEQKNSRRISLVVFLFVTLLFLGAFNFIPIPSQEYAYRAVEQLMLERVILESISNLEVRESEDDSEQIEETEEPSDPAQDVEFEDLEQLMEAFDAFSLSETEVSASDLTREERSDLASLSQKELDLESEDLETAFGGRSLDLTSDLEKRDDSGRRTSRELRPSLLSDRGVVGRERLGSRSGLSIGSGRSDTGLNLRETNLDSENLLQSTRDEDDPPEETDPNFDLSADRLRNWILANQGPLDPGIRSLFQYLPGNLTAKTQITTSGTSYGLQLMHTPDGGETHIAIIDGEVLFYFVDSGRRQQAGRFEKGLVRSDEESRVIVVESEDLSARSEEAIRAFKLFVDWWTEQQKIMDSNG